MDESNPFYVLGGVITNKIWIQVLENRGNPTYSALWEVKFRYTTNPIDYEITPGTEITVNIQLDEYTAGFVRHSLQQDLFSLYGFPVKSSGLGSIDGYTDDNITLSGFTDPTLNDKKILAIERWYNGGWSPSSMGTNVIVGFTGTGLTTENAPVLKYNNVFYPALEVATPENWGGVTIDGGFQIVRYSNLGLAIHTEVFPGASDIAPTGISEYEDTKTLSFHDPNIITQLSGGSIYNTSPSPQILSNINMIGSGLVQNGGIDQKVHNSGTLIIEGELQLHNGALFTNTGYIIIKPGGKIRLYNGDEILPSDKRYLGFVIDGKVNNSDPRGIILVEGTEKIYLYNQRHITLYGNSNLITTTTGDPINLESSTNNIIYKGDGSPTPPAYDHSTWLSISIP